MCCYYRAEDPVGRERPPPEGGSVPLDRMSLTSNYSGRGCSPAEGLGAHWAQGAVGQARRAFVATALATSRRSAAADLQCAVISALTCGGRLLRLFASVHSPRGLFLSLARRVLVRRSPHRRTSPDLRAVPGVGGARELLGPSPNVSGRWEYSAMSTGMVGAVDADSLGDVVRTALGADHRISGVTALRGGSKKGVYRVTCTGGARVIFYIWDDVHNHWPADPNAQPDDGSNPLVARHATSAG